MEQMEEKIPTYSISTSVNDGIVEIVVTGEVERGSAGNLRSDVHSIAKSMNAEKIICDLRNAADRSGYAETYFGVMNTPSFFYNIEIGIVDILERSNIRVFHEYTARTAGIPLKWFTDMEAARAWLKNKTVKQSATVCLNDIARNAASL